jgi:hypothetical protein
MCINIAIRFLIQSTDLTCLFAAERMCQQTYRCGYTEEDDQWRSYTGFPRTTHFQVNRFICLIEPHSSASGHGLW